MTLAGLYRVAEKVDQADRLAVVAIGFSPDC
jgi:hypothetical protein